MITGVNKITIHVRDQQQALEFWRDKVGFSVITDASYGENRWIEVASPNGGLVLAITTHPEDITRRKNDIPALQPNVSALLACDDLQATFEEMSVAGVVFVTPPSKQGWGWWSMFSDGQGNRFGLVPEGQ